MGAGEEGAPAAAGQVSAGRRWGGTRAHLPPGSWGSLFFFLKLLCSSCPCYLPREVRPDTQYTGRRRKPRF